LHRSEPQEKEKERVLVEDSQTPQKERAAKNKSEDPDNVTQVKISQKDTPDIAVSREMVDRQLSANVPLPPTALANESSSLLSAAVSSSNTSSQGADTNVPDPSEVPLIQPQSNDPSAPQQDVADSHTSTPLAGPPTTPKEKPRSHKKKKPPKTPTPALLPPPGAPLVVQTGGEEGAEVSESRQDTSSSLLLSPTTSMSSPPPGSMMSPESESKEKKVRKRTKFDQATIDVLTRSYEESPKPETSVIVSLSQQLGLDPYIVRVWFTNRRQKDKRIASGGSVSAGAAYRNPSTDGQPPPPSSSSSSAATSLTDGQPAAMKTTPIKEAGGGASSRPVAPPGGKPLVKRCHKAKGGCSHIIIDGQHYNRKELKAREEMEEKDRKEGAYTKEDLIFGVATQPAGEEDSQPAGSALEGQERGEKAEEVAAKQ